jgi:hypothetical protein
MSRRPLSDANFVVNLKEFKQVQDEARVQFLNTIVETAPKVLRQLRNNVLPTYRATLSQLLSSGLPVTTGNARAWRGDEQKSSARFSKNAEVFKRGPGRALLHWPAGKFAQTRPGEEPEDVSDLERALLKWAMENNIHLKKAWLYNCALETLFHWCQSKPEDSWVTESMNDDYMLISEDYYFDFQFPQLNLSTDTWKSYRDKLDLAFEKAKKNYRRELEALWKKNGRFAARRNMRSMHFEWLVEHHVNGLKYTEIQTKYELNGVHASNRFIGEAVRQISRLLELEPRSRRS